MVSTISNAWIIPVNSIGKAEIIIVLSEEYSSSTDIGVLPG